ncbi:MAG: hypothetical protein EOM02_09440, partial [Synergistales bacterium]|nr:hypothetical protein [Synergistales bacterium]
MLIDVKGMGLVEFPDSMPLDEIKKAIDSQLSSPDALSINKADKVGNMRELRERYKETLLDASPSKQAEPSTNGSLLSNAVKNMGANWLSSKGAMELLRASETGQAANMEDAQDVIALPRQGVAPLSPVEEALKLRELSARQTGDVEAAKKNRDALMGRVAGMEESALSKLESGRKMHVDYDLPENELAAKTLQAIESAGFTAESAAKAGAGWALGGPLGGALMGISNTLTEAETEAGSVFLDMLKEGASPEEIKNAMRVVRGGNIAMLPFMNATGDVVSFGLDKGLEAASKRIVGDKLIHKAARTALKKGVPYVANSMIEGGEEFGQEAIAQRAQGKPFDKQEAVEAAKVGALSGLLYTLIGRGSREAMSRITGLEKQARKESPKDQRRAYVDIFERMENGDVSIGEIVPLLTARQKLEIVSNAVLEFKDLRQRQRGGESLDGEQTKKLSTLSNAIGLLSSEGEDAALIKMSEVMDIPSWIRERSSTDVDSHVYRGGLDEGLFINSDETAIVPKGESIPAVKEPTSKSVVPLGEAHRPLSDMTLDNATLYTSSEIEANRNRLERSLGKMTKAQIREQFGVVSNRGDKRDSLISKVIDGLKTEADNLHAEKTPRAIPMGG